jgi:hypothetical protein
MAAVYGDNFGCTSTRKRSAHFLSASSDNASRKSVIVANAWFGLCRRKPSASLRLRDRTRCASLDDLPQPTILALAVPS